MSPTETQTQHTNASWDYGQCVSKKAEHKDLQDRLCKSEAADDPLPHTLLTVYTADIKEPSNHASCFVASISTENLVDGVEKHLATLCVHIQVHT